VHGPLKPYALRFILKGRRRRLVRPQQSSSGPHTVHTGRRDRERDTTSHAEARAVRRRECGARHTTAHAAGSTRGLVDTDHSHTPPCFSHSSPALIPSRPHGHGHVGCLAQAMLLPHTAVPGWLIWSVQPAVRRAAVGASKAPSSRPASPQSSAWHSARRARDPSHGSARAVSDRDAATAQPRHQLPVRSALETASALHGSRRRDARHSLDW
jgi:hypothetical protein